MTTLNFPSSPSLNDEYTFGSKTWIWNGTAWNLKQNQPDVLLDLIKTVDGTGSGLDADLLDGNHATAFYPASNPDGYITSSGIAANVSGVVAIANGGTGASTRQEAIDALAGAVTSGQYLRGDGTDVVMSAIQAGDVPTLNQNTTGTASNVTGTVVVANGGTGATSLATNNVILGNGTSAVQTVAPGTNGNVLTSDGTTWVSQASAGGASSGVLEAVASGSLSDGTKVIINADGTVSAVALSAGPPVIGTTTVFESSNNTSAPIVSVYHVSENKIVLIRSNNAYVGTISGANITFSTPVSVFSLSSTILMSGVYHPIEQKIVLFGSDNGTGVYVVGTITSGIVSFSTQASFEFNVFNAGQPQDATYDSTNNIIVFTYNVGTNSHRVRAATLSGTTLTFGTHVQISSQRTSAVVAHDPNQNRIVVVTSGNGSPIARSFSVSETTLTSSSSLTLVSTFFDPMRYSLTYDSTSQKMLLLLQSHLSPNGCDGLVLTVLPTSMTAGARTALTSVVVDNAKSIYISSIGKFAVAFSSASGAGAGFTLATISGTTVSFNTTSVITSSNTYMLSQAYNSVSNRIVVSYSSAGNSNFGVVNLIEPESQIANLTAENFIGISNASYANGDTATIQTVGSIDDAQSGLTAGQAYYVQTDGTLSTTPSSPNVFAGTAVSATQLLIAKTIESSLLSVAEGGTGASSLTANNVILGNGTSAVQTVAPGTSGNVLTSNGTTWTSAALAGSGISLEATVNLTGSSSYTLTFSDRSKSYLIVLDSLNASLSNRNLILYYYQNSTFITNTFAQHVSTTGSSSATYSAVASASTNGLNISRPFNFGTLGGTILISAITGNRPQVNWQVSQNDVFGGTTIAHVLGSGSRQISGGITAVQLVIEGTTFSSGKLLVYRLG